MSTSLRRLSACAFLATVATVASPLVTEASAATFAGTISTSPAPETVSATKYVYANRPGFIATFTGALDPASTITVKDGTTAITCQPIVSGAQVSCVPSSDLISGHVYNVTAHGKQASDGTEADATPASFTDAHPALSVAKPVARTTLVDGAQAISLTFTDPLRGGGISADTTHSYLELYDSIGNLIADRSDDQFAGGSTNPITGAVTPNNGISVSHALASGAKYELKSHVEGVAADGTTPVPGASHDEDYIFYVSNEVPGSLVAPTTTVNIATKGAIPLSGTAAPGLTVKVSAASTGGGTGTGSTVVAPCTDPNNTVPVCPWNLSLNGSSLGTGTGSWTAQTQDVNSKTSATTAGPPFPIDVTAPSNMPSVTASNMAPGATTLPVSATTADTDIASWTVTITDANGHSIGPSSFPATGGNTLPTHNFDVTSLDDGTLTVAVQATDAAGNPGTKTGTATPTKNAGLKPDFDNSSLQVQGVTVPFAAAESHPVQAPTSLTVAFAEPITPVWTDHTGSPNPNDAGTPHTSTMCVTAGAGSNSCLPGTTSIAGDGDSMTFTFAGKLVDAGSPYTVAVHVWPKAWCRDLAFSPTPPQPTPSANCIQYNGGVPDHNGADFLFTVDNTPPSAPSVTMPSTIDGGSISTVGITGVAEKGSKVVVTVSSTGGGFLIANPGGTPVTAAPDGTWSMVSNFSSLGDGVLTVQAVATDAAGNASNAGSPASAPVLKARPDAPGSLSATTTATSASLFWTTPAPNGSPLGNYVLTYADTTVGGDPVTLDPAPSATATNAALSPLITGHAYLVKLCATNAATDGTDGKCHVSQLTVTPKAVTKLTATISKSVVTSNSPITLSGRLTRTDLDAGLTGKSVTITPKSDTGALGTPVTVPTNSTGNWTYTYAHVTKNATYLVSFAGDAGDTASTASVRSLVTVVLKITRIHAASTSHTSPVSISGTITPSQVGRTVYIYGRLSTAKTYTKLGTAKITSSNTWTFTKSFVKGTWYLYAKYLTQNGNTGANSQLVTFSRS